MTPPIRSLLLLGLIFAWGNSPTLAQDRPSKWESPGHAYSLVLSEGADSSRLTLFHHAKELAHYAFEGELVSIYWSPGGHYVALNNHNGHRGWYPWILNLQNGHVIRKNDEQKSASYNRYEDYTYLPDVPDLARSRITFVYPGYARDTDQNGEGHITVIYGWENETTLRMFDEVVLDQLFKKEKMRLSICSLLTVRDAGLSADSFSVEKTSYSGSPDHRPPEVLKVLGY
jgi:hypothetical protein